MPSSLPPPSPDRNNPRPYRPNDADADPSRVHRLQDSKRPIGGPFGPGNKKKRDEAAKKWRGGSGGDRTPDNRFDNRARDDRDNPNAGNRSAAVNRDNRPGGRGGFGPNRPNDRPNDRPQGNGYGKSFDGPYKKPSLVPDSQRLAPSAPPPSQLATRNSQPPQTDWGDVAEWYDNLVGDEGSEFHQQVVLPGTLRLLGDVAGRKILDIACGQGVLCRQLVAKGAEMTGVDAAAELLDAARKRGPETIVYKYADATALDGIQDASFDAATCLLAIQNIQSVFGVCAAAARVLKPDGHLVIVMMHPAFRSPKATQWGWDGDVQYRRVDRYLLPRKEPIITHPGKPVAEGGGQYTWTFHRPIGDYVKCLRNAGLLVDSLEEWASHKHSDSGPRAPAENVARKEIPMFLALRAVKVVRSQTPTSPAQSDHTPSVKPAISEAPSPELPASETPLPETPA
jgi:ubiquinone/menaquinone biosynthesis C-methylase UbiE